MSSDPHDDDDSADSGPAFSREAVTPRGGFMARPGFKVPPRHAVVVRVGDAPESEDIPLARSSVAPPPPPSEPAPVSASDKITLRAIPTPSSRRRNLEAEAAGDSPASYAPLSDAPLAASVPPPASASQPRRRRVGSGLTIAMAAALGLLFGLASIATRARAPQPTELVSPAAQSPRESAPVAAPRDDVRAPRDDVAIAATSAEPAVGVLPTPSASVQASATSESAEALPKSQRSGHRPHVAPAAAGAGAKHNIF